MPTEPQKPVIAVLGRPCSGKSTVAAFLAEKLGFKHVDGKGPTRAVVNTVNTSLAEENPHGFVFSDFPTQMQHLESWSASFPSLQIAYAIILEATEDVCGARPRGTGGAEASADPGFESALGVYKSQQFQVLQQFAGSGQARYINACMPLEWVKAAALASLRRTAVLAFGGPASKKTSLLGAAAMTGADVLHIYVNDLLTSAAEEDDGAPISSAKAVELIKAEADRLGSLGGVFVLDGFPRSVEDVEEWRKVDWVETLLALRFGSDAKPPSAAVEAVGEALRAQFYLDVVPISVDDGPAGCKEPPARGRLKSILRASQPLSIVPGLDAAALLQGWMAAAPTSLWWSLDTGAVRRYSKYLGMQFPYVGPATSPSHCPHPEAWLIWLGHLLNSEGYEADCPTGRVLGPLPPPMTATWLKRKATPASSAYGPHNLRTTSAYLQLAAREASGAFVDALGALDVAGLAPLSDPRSYGQLSEPLLRLLDVLSLHYRRFLWTMVEAGPASAAGPPAELDWLWHAHVSFPGAYKDDCRRLFGRAVPHRGGSMKAKGSQDTPDAGKEKAKLLGRLLKEELTALASAQAEALKALPLVREPEDVVVLGSLLPGGDRPWLGERLRDCGSVGAALAQAHRLPETAQPPSLGREPLVADPTVVEVTVQLLSGEVKLRRRLPDDTTVQELRQELVAEGENQVDNYLKLYVGGAELTDAMRIGDADLPSTGGVISLVRVKKPPPPPPPPEPARERSWSPRCTCFTSDCIFTVLTKSGAEKPKAMSMLQVGDMVRTGSGDKTEAFRRVTRVWPCAFEDYVQTVTLSPGCRLTAGHPVHDGKRWRRPEDLAAFDETYEEVVYTVEIEGHVDTLNVGGVVCAALGVFCGESFGWNLFTRKTVPCDRQPCRKCEKAVRPELDFSAVDLSMMATRYEPY